MLEKKKESNSLLATIVSLFKVHVASVFMSIFHSVSTTLSFSPLYPYLISTSSLNHINTFNQLPTTQTSSASQASNVTMASMSMASLQMNFGSWCFRFGVESFGGLGLQALDLGSVFWVLGAGV